MFESRLEAGGILFQKLLKFKGMIAQACVEDALVLAIPRGGVVVGKVISNALHIPLGVIYAKKIPTPDQPELAAGAYIAKSKKFGKTPDVKGKIIILVDDGVATGATVEAAIKYLRGKKVKKLVLAVPVAPKSLVKKLKKLVDEILVLETRDDFFAVGDFYKDFSQVTDEEVIQLLQR
ncbi:MAG: phosphoribosyltransferase family protein [Candidatus Woesebacteria bacterium]|nr:phosphoribosyltransferase family protein [Candidatus Woesebacteria bacterium]